MKNLTIILVGIFAIAGIYFYKEYEKRMEAKRRVKPPLTKVVKDIPRKNNSDVFYEKACAVPGYSCKDFDLDGTDEEGLILKDKILYIVKNYKTKKFKTKEAYEKLELRDKVRAQAYAYSVHPKVLGVLSYGSKLLAARIYIIHNDFGELKLLEGYELTKEVAMKIPVKMSRTMQEELFIGGNIKLADAYFKDKLKLIPKN